MLSMSTQHDVVIKFVVIQDTLVKLENRNILLWS